VTEGRAGQPEGKAREEMLYRPVQVQAGLPSKKRSLRQPNTGDASTRAVSSSVVAGLRAPPAAWHSQETEVDYPAARQLSPPRQPTPVLEETQSGFRRRTAAEETDVLEQRLTELRRLAEAACQRQLAEVTTQYALGQLEPGLAPPAQLLPVQPLLTKDSITRRRRGDQQLAGSAGQVVGIWVNSGNARLLLADKLHPHPCVHTPSQRA